MFIGNGRYSGFSFINKNKKTNRTKKETIQSFLSNYPLILLLLFIIYIGIHK